MKVKMRPLVILVAGTTARALLVYVPLQAQHAENHSDHHFGLNAALILSRISPAPGRTQLTEAYLTRTMVHGHGQLSGFEYRGALNFEGITVRRGELNPGAAGEGYVDRRHPHTLLHEATMTKKVSVVSLTVGRGFVGFGTDDPMIRDFIKYPANHHLSQILERWIVIGALKFRFATLEGSLFNGDEPTGWTSMGQLKRFGDSRAVRLTVDPGPGVELQASAASVESPEVARGGGVHHEQFSSSLRFHRAIHTMTMTALGEYAVSTQTFGNVDFGAPRSVLVESALQHGSLRLAVRFERTDRFEEERLSTFRTSWPPADNLIAGHTLWRIASAQTRVRLRAIDVISEVERASIKSLQNPAALDLQKFFDTDTIWTFSIGVELGANRMTRMGRYGMAARPT